MTMKKKTIEKKKLNKEGVNTWAEKKAEQDNTLQIVQNSIEQTWKYYSPKKKEEKKYTMSLTGLKEKAKKKLKTKMIEPPSGMSILKNGEPGGSHFKVCDNKWIYTYDVHCYKCDSQSFTVYKYEDSIKLRFVYEVYCEHCKEKYRNYLYFSDVENSYSGIGELEKALFSNLIEQMKHLHEKKFNKQSLSPTPSKYNIQDKFEKEYTVNPAVYDAPDFISHDFEKADIKQYNVKALFIDHLRSPLSGLYCMYCTNTEVNQFGFYTYRENKKGPKSYIGCLYCKQCNEDIFQVKLKKNFTSVDLLNAIICIAVIIQNTQYNTETYESVDKSKSDTNKPVDKSKAEDIKVIQELVATMLINGGATRNEIINLLLSENYKFITNSQTFQQQPVTLIDKIEF